jgi:signal transduction histidine kinase
MGRVKTRRTGRLITMYVLSLAATFALLVVWIAYVVRSGNVLADLGRRINAPLGASGRFPWVVLTVGGVLLFFLVVGLTYQLAQALAARRYALKQEEFVSNVTHEMKSPLAAIKLHAQTLRQQAELSGPVRDRFLGVIEQQADRMASLVDNVLESSRLLARKHSMELVAVDLAAFLDDYLRGARANAEVRGVRLLADVRLSSRVLGNEEALRRIFDNLIDNAVRFSSRGGEVRFRAWEDAGRSWLQVEDDGVGIPKQELAYVFERFYQAGGADDPHRRGTGLGLSIVAGLVSEMGGTVQAFSHESSEGRGGSRFLVELPALLPATAEPPEAQQLREVR